MKKFLAMMLALVMVLSLAACGGEKAPETTAPVAGNDAPETQAPETQAPETQAPETQAPETQAPAVEETTAAAAPEQTQAPTTEAPKAEGGCGGMIAGGVAIIAILGTALLIKKED